MNGKSYTQSLTVKNDPRSPPTLADLRAQHALAMKIYDGIREAWDGYQQVNPMRTGVTAARTESPAEVATAATAFQAKLNEAMLKAFPGACAELGKVVAAWRSLNETELAAFSAGLAKNNVKPVAAAPALPPPPCS
ncbi:MAG TPA: hypothetical protein VGQ17_02480 [Gemmatimonadales bacterium]|jgi:hypothetical protein|nr:hypothetical protein [Gemmatimonadales bacterium]